MARASRSIFAVAIAVALASIVAPARDAEAALFGTLANTTAIVAGGGPPANQDGGDGIAAASSFNVAGDAFGGTASGKATAALGNLGAAVTTQASLVGNASATATASFFDTLTVTGTPGGIASFSFALVVDAMFPAILKGGSNTSITANLTANGVSAAFGVFATSPPPASALMSPAAFTLDVPVGDVIDISSQLIVGDTGEVDGSDSDASDPLRVFITPLTPGDGYISAGGGVYTPTSAAVPEPGSLLLLGSGLAALLGFGMIEIRGRRNPV